MKRRPLRVAFSRTAYRLLLTAGALVLLATLPWSSLAPLLDPAGATDGERPAVFVVLLLVTIATALLTLNYPGRSDVSLLALPVALTWWATGAAAAIVVAASAALIGNALRRQSPLVTLAGTARLIFATAAGLAGAEIVGPGAVPAGLDLSGTPPPALSPALALAVAAFFALFSLTDAVLDGLDAALGEAPAHAARTDAVTNLALIPLVLILTAVGQRIGSERLAVLLGGSVALLWVVRSAVNLRTLHGALQRLHRDVAEEREKLATLIEHSGEGIYTVDDALRVTGLNPAMSAILGRRPADLEGLPCAQACHFHDLNGQPICPDRCPLRRAQDTGQPVTEEVVYAPPAGASRPAGAGDAGGAEGEESHPRKHLLLTYAAAGDAGQPLRLGIGIARDVTAQKEAERLRADFVSLVTHELRSPLTISSGYVNLLRRTLQTSSRPVGADAERVWRYLDRIEGAEQHLLRLVNSLLDMARLERTDLPVEYSAVAVDQLVEDAVEAIVPAAVERGLRLEREGSPAPPRLWSSELYLQEIIANLLSNAVKYTPPGGTVKVSVTVDEAPDETPQLLVTVADTGYGLTDEEQAQLFTRFFRSSRPEVRREAGTGLGLAFTRQMVERIGGTIEVRSVAGQGSRFTVAFPLRTPTPLAADVTGDSPEDSPEEAGAPDGDGDVPEKSEKSAVLPGSA